MRKKEVRTSFCWNTGAIELRAMDTDDGLVLEGYAAKFGVLSEDLGGFREKIKRGAFSESLKGSPDIRAFFDHDTKYILGRTPDTLELVENSVGLRMQVKPPDTQLIRDLVIEPVKLGMINQMSFGFITRKDEWLEKDDEITRTLVDVELFEVSVVSMPAYNDTSVAVRKFQELKVLTPEDYDNWLAERTKNLKKDIGDANSSVLTPGDRHRGGDDTFVLMPDAIITFETAKELMQKISKNP